MTPALGYSKMKDSGVQWLGNYPAHWNLGKVKNVFSSTKTIVGDDVDNYERLALTLNGVIKRSKTDAGGLQPEKFETYQILRENELVFKLIDLQNVATSRVGRSPYTGIVSPAYIILHERSGRSTKYAEYYFLSMWMHHVFNQLGADGVRSNIGASALLNIPFLIPPENEQKAIVTYLDTQCAKIDEIIAEAKASIEDYKQWKASIIYEAVTKGLDPDVEMKESGIPWVGNIPEDWNVLRGKNILTLLERPIEPNDDVVTCFRDGEVTLRKKRREEGFTNSLKEIGYQGIEPGDLIVHGMDGFAGAIGISDSRGKASPVLNVMDSEQNKRYLMYYLRAMAYKDVFMSLSTGIRVRSCDLGWNKLSVFSFVIPSKDEQNTIATFLDAQCAKIDELSAEKQALISELESYKKSLIYEVVTGKRRIT